MAEVVNGDKKDKKEYSFTYRDEIEISVIASSLEQAKSMAVYGVDCKVQIIGELHEDFLEFDSDENEED